MQHLLDKCTLPFPKGSRIAVAMSGGVDSSATAALLVQKGYEVIGLTMQLWDQEKNSVSSIDLPSTGRTCCATEDVYDARRIAETLSIPFYVVNFESQFYQAVVKRFIEDYQRGLTPNPCILCNEVMKFDLLLKKAQSLEAKALVTGHYAIIGQDAKNAWALYRATDLKKDQSYFLYSLPKRHLSQIAFPLGYLTKSETRKLATGLGLHVAEKQESQDVCFVPHGNYGAFFSHQAPESMIPGAIVDQEGQKLAIHKGIPCYTVGQRRGLGISAPTPLYVTAIDGKKKQVIVGTEKALYKRELTIHNPHWLLDKKPKKGLSIEAKIRYASPAEPAYLQWITASEVRIIFEKPQRAISPGQACVFYHGDRVLGGGWIASDTVRA
ncbi:tRNA 2-thiouridine(34) synthase MnmA [Magnetococcales bacterium HHB-1]